MTRNVLKRYSAGGLLRRNVLQIHKRHETKKNYSTELVPLQYYWYAKLLTGLGGDTTAPANTLPLGRN